jgi:hypothetical protein
MATVKADRGRPFVEHVLEPHQPSGFVREKERRHQLAGLRNGRNRTAVAQPSHKAIDGGCEIRVLDPSSVRDRGQAIF